MINPSRLRPPPANQDASALSGSDLAVGALVWVVVTLKVVETVLARVPFGPGATVALFVAVGLPVLLLRHLLDSRPSAYDDAPDAAGRPYR